MKSLLLALLLVFCGACRSPQSSDKLREDSHSAEDADQIRLVVYDYILKRLPAQAAQVVIFVDVKTTGLQQLSASFPHLSLKPIASAKMVRGRGPRDKSTGQFGLFVTSGRTQIRDGKTKISAGYIGGGTVSRFFTLEKSTGWHIVEVGHETIGD